MYDPAALIHKRSTMNYKRIAHAPLWVFSEIIWYLKWWFSLFLKICHMLYQFGELVLAIGVKIIDLHDMIWDEFELKISNMREENVLD